MSSPTDLPSHVQRIVDEIENEIGDDPARPGSAIEGNGSGVAGRLGLDPTHGAARASARTRTPWSEVRMAASSVYLVRASLFLRRLRRIWLLRLFLFLLRVLALRHVGLLFDPLDRMSSLPQAR